MRKSGVSCSQPLLAKRPSYVAAARREDDLKGVVRRRARGALKSRRRATRPARNRSARRQAVVQQLVPNRLVRHVGRSPARRRPSAGVGRRVAGQQGEQLEHRAAAQQRARSSAALTPTVPSQAMTSPHSSSGCVCGSDHSQKRAVSSSYTPSRTVCGTLGDRLKSEPPARRTPGCRRAPAACRPRRPASAAVSSIDRADRTSAPALRSADDRLADAPSNCALISWAIAWTSAGWPRADDHRGSRPGCGQGRRRALSRNSSGVGSPSIFSPNASARPIGQRVP